ncbi:GNAT family N-acetyltransferase [Alicyclobacillus fastidiosus]|uniref:GNAT family N-acetyltransferase n=1 Tax=Alicyclobacillus fastidiosus TaxID=392011 RepID=A0ABY6ZHL0_9BACL|nr:GNAT family N-acetyltransferase [Alicyclobacillus fastidiosus]WAH42375.1 GNAT family N-acetyltransferase [Alicyclobacillus fastidiosus]GMA64188.1 acetyltransferase [Alicyclobacillus fastidiosus]
MYQDFEIDMITKDDGLALQNLAHSVGWNFTTGQTNLFISPAGKLFGYRFEGNLVASAGIYIYGSALASLGVVIVHSGIQRKGLGKSIVKHCLIEAERVGAPVMLVATEQGFPLYKSLGFQTIGNIHRFEVSKLLEDIRINGAFQVDQVQEGDLDQLIALDETVIGANRSRLYPVLFSNMECGYVVRNSQNTVVGFGLAGRRNNVLVVGPMVADTQDVALTLMRTFVSGWSGPVRIDVPSQQEKFMKHLLTYGFEEKMISPLMILNAHELGGKRDQLYGIADPVFG